VARDSRPPLTTSGSGTMRFSTNQRRQPAEINVTSLVDIIFNLLLFFMLTTSFSQSAGLEVRLPSASASDAEVRPRDLVVALTRDGHTVVEGKSLTAEQLNARIADLKKRDAKATVIVQADKEVAHGRVVEVLDAAKSAGLKSVAIATRGQ
jgi:biopolymer transport protein ExbD